MGSSEGNDDSGFSELGQFGVLESLVVPRGRARRYFESAKGSRYHSRSCLSQRTKCPVNGQPNPYAVQPLYSQI